MQMVAKLAHLSTGQVFSDKYFIKVEQRERECVHFRRYAGHKQPGHFATVNYGSHY